MEQHPSHQEDYTVCMLGGLRWVFCWWAMMDQHSTSPSVQTIQYNQWRGHCSIAAWAPQPGAAREVVTVPAQGEEALRDWLLQRWREYAAVKWKGVHLPPFSILHPW